MQYYVDSKIEFYKKQLLSSYNQSAQVFSLKKQLLKQLHIETLKILHRDMDTDLSVLKKQLNKKFNLKDMDVNTYLIDENYTIYKTTFPKDLGFNLGLIKEAKNFLDKTKKDSKIYISNFVSTDLLDMKYKLYAYSLLKDNTYLETGITDNKIGSIWNSIIAENNDTGNKIKFYTIYENKKKYYYYDMIEGIKKSTKKEYFKDSKNFFKTKQGYNNIIEAYLTHKTVAIKKGNSERIFVPFFDKDMYSKIGFTNIIMQLDIDISHQLQVMKRFENIFFASVSLIVLFLILIFFLIKNNFTRPIKLIIKSINHKKLVEDRLLLEKNDELGIVAKEYNTLLKSLKREIVTNTQLLDENKRFIADTVHQIRTPLTNIMMNSDMIKLTVEGTSADEFIDQINSSINMLTNSYEDLSYVISHDNIVYTPVHLSLSEILKDRISFFTTIAKVNHKIILGKIEDGINFRINQIELERLIDNNISNAVKYADRNKTISINLHQDGDIITLSFSSYSEQIKNTSKLFEKNYRENESKRGLG
jgi:signal transduction histidine kinase